MTISDVKYISFVRVCSDTVIIAKLARKEFLIIFLSNPLKIFSTGFPLGLENLEKWEDIFQSGKSQGILNRLEKSGKIKQNFRQKLFIIFSDI